MIKKYNFHPSFHGIRVFLFVDIIERSMHDPISRFHDSKKNYPIMAAAKSFGDTINIYSFED